MYVSMNAHRHGDGKHGGAGVWRRVGVGLKFLDIDAVFGEESGQIANDAGVIHGHHIHCIGYNRLRSIPFLGSFVNNSQPQLIAQRPHLSIELGQCVPWPGKQHDQGELSAQYSHTTFFDIAPALGNFARKLIDETNFIFSRSGDYQIIILIVYSHGFLKFKG